MVYEVSQTPEKDEKFLITIGTDPSWLRVHAKRFHVAKNDLRNKVIKHRVTKTYIRYLLDNKY